MTRQRYNPFQRKIDEIMSLVGNNGGKFETEKEVREYFTVRNFERMFPGEDAPDQERLDLYADLVISFRDTDASMIWEDNNG